MYIIGALQLFSSGKINVKPTLKENIDVYFNILQGFLLICHRGMIGAGPTLHKSISSSVKNVVTTTVWEACVAAYDQLHCHRACHDPDRRVSKGYPRRDE
jgi:hypothetical protein